MIEESSDARSRGRVTGTLRFSKGRPERRQLYGGEKSMMEKYDGIELSATQAILDGCS